MSKRQLLRLGALALLAGAVGGCIGGPHRYPLAGRYYVELSEDGDPSCWFDDPAGRPEQLGPAYPVETGVVKGYVAVCGNGGCYLFADTARTAAAARNGQLGPFTGAECQQKVVQLTGDTLRLGSVM